MVNYGTLGVGHFSLGEWKSQANTADARRVIEERVEGERRDTFVDMDKIVALVKQHELVRFLLSAERDKRTFGDRRTSS